MDRDQFMATMMQPEAGDEMAFRLDKDDDVPGAFSMEAVEALSEQYLAFTLARVSARWTETGRPPRSMTVNVSIDWDADGDLSKGPPWWQLDDKTPTPADGADRLDASRRIG